MTAITRDHLIIAYGQEYLLRAERVIGACSEQGERTAIVQEFFGRDAVTVPPLLDPPTPEADVTPQGPTSDWSRNSAAHVQGMPGKPRE